MNNKENHDGLNEFEKQIQEINEWQKNANNPGYYVGSGKAPIPMKNLLKSPIVMLIVGIIFLVPTIYNIAKSFNIYSISSDIMTLIIGTILLVGGISRLFIYKD